MHVLVSAPYMYDEIQFRLPQILTIGGKSSRSEILQGKKGLNGPMGKKEFSAEISNSRSAFQGWVDQGQAATASTPSARLIDILWLKIWSESDVCRVFGLPITRSRFLGQIFHALDSSKSGFTNERDR